MARPVNVGQSHCSKPPLGPSAGNERRWATGRARSGGVKLLIRRIAEIAEPTS